MKHVYLLLCLAVMPYGRPAVGEPAPVIHCDEPTFHFGAMANDQSVEHTFVIHNKGDVTLQIQRIKPACGCTVIKKYPKEIAPGEAVEIDASLSLRNRSGQVKKTIRIDSNDPASPQYTLAFEGTAMKPYDLKPGALHLFTSDPDQVVSNAAELSFNIKDQIIKEAQIKEAYIIPSVETLDPGRRYRITAALKPPYPLQDVHSQIKLLDEKRQVLASIPLRIKIQKKLVVSPDIIMLPKQSEQPLERYVLVRGDAVKNFKILGVEIDDEQVKSEWTDMQGRGYRVKLYDIMPGHSWAGKKVVITTDVGGMERIEVPITVQ